jgi:hypothetical protein
MAPPGEAIAQHRQASLQQSEKQVGLAQQGAI